jgi:hypothetical protein
MTITIWPPQVAQAGRGISETLGDADADMPVAHFDSGGQG